jgi:hypothetical protein
VEVVSFYLRAEMDRTEAVALMKHYEELAVKAKDRVWTVTTWLLTLNSGLIAFSFKYYADNKTGPFLPFELLFCTVGIVLCCFNQILIRDYGKHIQGYWTISNKITENHPYLRSLIGQGMTEGAAGRKYEASFPRFCRRLLALTWLFIAGFAGIAVLMSVLAWRG